MTSKSHACTNFFVNFTGQKTADKKMSRKGDKQITKTKSIDDCAKKCLKETGFNCNSFDFCIGDGDVFSCQLFSADGNQQLSDSKNCEHHSRK